jgi:hypothetical protein
MPRNLMPALVAALIATACAEELSVHVRSGDRPPDPGFLVLSTGVDVDRFQIVMRNLRLQSDPTDGGFSTPDMIVIGPGPYLVDLSGPNLTGGVFTELVSGFSIRPKGYYEMDIDLVPVSSADIQANAALAPLLGKTYVITGRNQQGTSFTFESSSSQVLVRESVFRMGLNHNNVDVNIAPNRWFEGPDGGPAIDPTTTDPALRSMIEANVAASIDAYEDDNMDGVPDPLG